MKRVLVILFSFMFFLSAYPAFAFTVQDYWFPGEQNSTRTFKDAQPLLCVIGTVNVKTISMDKYKVLQESKPLFGGLYTGGGSGGPFGAFRYDNGMFYGPGAKANEWFKGYIEELLKALNFVNIVTQVKQDEWVVFRGPLTPGSRWTLNQFSFTAKTLAGDSYSLDAEYYGKIECMEDVPGFNQALVVSYGLLVVDSNDDGLEQDRVDTTWGLIPGIGPVKIRDSRGVAIVLADYSIIPPKNTNQPQPGQSVNPSTGKTTTTWGAIKSAS